MSLFMKMKMQYCGRLGITQGSFNKDPTAARAGIPGVSLIGAFRRGSVAGVICCLPLQLQIPIRAAAFIFAPSVVVL